MSGYKMSCILLLIILLARVNTEPKALHKLPSEEDSQNMSMMGSPSIYAHIKDMPFVARLVSRYKRHQTHCGGSLISPKWVLTALQCVEYNTTTLSMVEVCMGESYLPSGYKCRYRRQVASIFTSGNKDVGLAVLELTESFPHIPQRIEAHALQLMDASEVFDNCTTVGWGEIISGKYSANLLQAVVHLQQGECPEPFICMYSYRRSLCLGDAGTPLICKNKIIGVAAMIPNWDCDTTHLPTFFISTSANLDFIQSVLESHAVVYFYSSTTLLLVPLLAAVRFRI